MSFLSLFLSGCTQIGFATANIPAYLNDAIIHKDIVFDNTTKQALDIHVPQQANNAPVLVFFYGGRWTDGEKHQYKFIADAFVKEGYIVVIPDYRKYPDVKFPAFVDDTAAAIAWVYNNIGNYNGNKNNLFVSGHSAGAHIAALAATDKRYLEKHNLNRDIISGFSGLSGPYAFVPKEADLKDMFGPPENYPNMRAPNFVDGKQPPMMLIHGLDDNLVYLENAEKLRDAIKDKGGDVELVTYGNLNHFETVGSLTWFWSYKSDIKTKMIEFFKANMEAK